jgi:monooxygenase
MTHVEHLDVLIVGAGLSGIGAAWHLQHDHPQRSYAILEARDASGGTWDLFRYPGIRSDSDLSTFAYAFRPWTGKAIADGPDIVRYLRETAEEAGIDQRIRYGHKVVRASWSTEDARWTVEAERDGEPVVLTASWLFCASGYYRYDRGFTPELPGIGDFEGQVIHPQQWPEDLDVDGKRIVVIGSGATAITLVPALAKLGAQVTQLQRTPSYVMPLPARDPVQDLLFRWFGPERGHRLTRKKNIARQRLLYKFCQRYPRAARKLIRKVNEKCLPERVDVDVHFNPPYDPWDQRLCADANGALYKALHKGTADIVTDTIETFTPSGVRTGSGQELEADVVVTATGLELLVFGGIELEVDGERVEVADRVAFKSMMLSGVPNFAFAIGYTNSSWTLKVDLVCEHLGRLMAHMDAHGLDQVVPVVDPSEVSDRPLLDFKAGYVTRSRHLLPRQGTRAPWLTVMDYKTDLTQLGSDVLDPALRFSRRPAAVPQQPVLAA